MPLRNFSFEIGDTKFRNEKCTILSSAVSINFYKIEFNFFLSVLKLREKFENLCVKGTSKAFTCFGHLKSFVNKPIFKECAYLLFFWMIIIIEHSR